MGRERAGAGTATGLPCLQRRRSLWWPMAPLLSAWLPTASSAATDEPARHAAPGSPAPAAPPRTTRSSADSIAAAALAALEQRAGGRLGVALLDTGSGAMTGHRLGERFALCSTFKLLLAAQVWRQIDQGRLKADQWVPLTPADMVAHAPVTRTRLARGGMTVAELAQAIQTTSDNPAANLLLGLLGGPAGFTARAARGRRHRDPARPARAAAQCGGPERSARHHHPGRDGPQHRPDADRRLARARLARDPDRLDGGHRDRRPPAARRMAGQLAAGDKTGTGLAPGLPDKINDVAIAWPPGRPPIVVTAYYETAVGHAEAVRAQDQAVLAEVGRIAARWA